MIRRIILIAGALLAGCQAEKATEPAGRDGFAFTAPVTPQGEGSLQKVEVPAAALVAIKRQDMGDLRILDGRGKPLSIARFEDFAASAHQAHDVSVYPIAGNDTASGGPAVSIAIAQPGQTISVETNGDSVTGGTSAILLDTRALEEPAVHLLLDADLPPQMPVDFAVDASSDLKTWETLAEAVLFSPNAGRPPLGGARFAMPSVNLKQRYLRLSWKAAPGIVVRGASVVSSRTSPPRRIAIPTKGGKLSNSHNISFKSPSATPLAAIEVVGSSGDGLIPMVLYGRQSKEHPWTKISAATIRTGEKPAVFELGNVSFGQYRIEADARSAGFARAPAIMLQLEPWTLLAAFNGQPPYRLVAGNAVAEGKLFAPSELASPAELSGILPKARIEVAPPGPIALDASRADTPFTPRKLALWGALLLGTAVLAWGAIRLLRANAGDQSAS